MSRWGRTTEELRLDIAYLRGEGETDIIEGLRRMRERQEAER